MAREEVREKRLYVTNERGKVLSEIELEGDYPPYYQMKKVETELIFHGRLSEGIYLTLWVAYLPIFNVRGALRSHPAVYGKLTGGIHPIRFKLSRYAGVQLFNALSRIKRRYKGSRGRGSPILL